MQVKQRVGDVLIFNKRVEPPNWHTVTTVGVVILLGLAIGFYATFSQSVGDSRVALVLLAVPVSIGLLMSKDSPRILFTFLILGLAFSARFRFGGAAFHPGGAEASLAPLDFPLFGLVFLLLAQLAITGQRLSFRFTLVEKALILFILIQALSLVIASDQKLAMLELLRLIKMGIIVLVVKFYVRSEKDLKYLVGVLLFVIILQGFIAISQSIFRTSLGLGFLGERESYWTLSRGSFAFGRAGGTLGHANALANFLELLLPLALAVYLSSIRGWLRYLAIAALCLGLIGLFLTFSRAGWGAILIGILVVVTTMTRFQAKRRGRVLLFMLLIVMLVVILGLTFQEAILQRLNLYGRSSWVIRIESYELAWQMIKENLWWGVGANNYLAASTDYLQSTRAPALAIVHNYFLLVIAETGLLGLLTLLLVLYGTRRQARRLMKTEGVVVPVVSVGLWAGLVAVLAHSMFDWLLRYDPIYTLFWFSVALLIAIGQIPPRGDRKHHLETC